MLDDLIDIGANLTHDSFDPDRDAVLERAHAAGVTQMVLTGSTVAVSEAALELARKHPGQLFASAGIHPHHARDLDEHSVPALRELLNEEEVVAVGECGLDYFRNFSSQEEQEAAFHAQLELAVESGLPVFLHQRDAHERFCAILREHIDGIEHAIAHCFTGGPQELRDYLDMGLFIGITGWICDERRGAALCEAVSLLPPERFMVETDAPYLLPRDLRPKPASRRNEPMHLPHVVQALAARMGMEAAEVAGHSTRNARRFFNLPAARATETISAAQACNTNRQSESP